MPGAIDQLQICPDNALTALEQSQFYERGVIGAHVDNVQAYKWAYISIACNNTRWAPDCKAARDRLSEKMPPEQVKQAEALAAEFIKANGNEPQNIWPTEKQVDEWAARGVPGKDCYDCPGNLSAANAAKLRHIIQAKLPFNFTKVENQQEAARKDCDYYKAERDGVILYIEVPQDKSLPPLWDVDLPGYMLG